MKNIKFRSWNICFYIFFALFILSFVLGTILYKTGRVEFLSALFQKVFYLYDKGFGMAFAVQCAAVLPFFALFVFGVTIYAPVTSFITVLLMGALSGGYCSYIMRLNRVALCIFEIIFSSITSYLLIIYSTMITLTALRIFTDVKKSDCPEIFDGTLFCAKGFRNIFNFRYIFSYIGFFLFICTFVTLAAALRTVAVTLF
jgi:hypothetical protein